MWIRFCGHLQYTIYMSTVTLTSRQWSRIYAFLCSQPDVYVGDEAQCRRFITAVLWVTRSGAQWRLLPDAYGKWNSVYRRFARWTERGIWERMHQHFSTDPDLEHRILDSTIVRAHPSAAGAPKKTVGTRPRRWDGAVAGSAPRSISVSTHSAILCALR